MSLTLCMVCGGFTANLGKVCRRCLEPARGRRINLPTVRETLKSTRQKCGGGVRINRRSTDY